MKKIAPNDVNNTKLNLVKHTTHASSIKCGLVTKRNTVSWKSPRRRTIRMWMKLAKIEAYEYHSNHN